MLLTKFRRSPTGAPETSCAHGVELRSPAEPGSTFATAFGGSESSARSGGAAMPSGPAGRDATMSRAPAVCRPSPLVTAANASSARAPARCLSVSAPGMASSARSSAREQRAHRRAVPQVRHGARLLTSLPDQSLPGKDMTRPPVTYPRCTPSPPPWAAGDRGAAPIHDQRSRWARSGACARSRAARWPGSWRSARSRRRTRTAAGCR
jgi:hypothetical protein